MGYPKERKEAVLKKMLPPNNKTIPEISKEEGICEGTLYSWRKAARAEGRLMPDGDSTPSGWCATDKFAAVVETASLNKAELSAYCRERGLYAEQLSEWREACEQANDWERNQNADNGSPMKGATMLATLQKLGVVPSFSRPSVSNDNPTQRVCSGQ